MTINLPLLHVAVAFAWIGLVAGETVLELNARDPAGHRLIAKIHGWIDIVFEIPLLILVTITGAVLLTRVWPAPTILLVKVGCALTGVVVNVVCIFIVRARIHATSDEQVQALSRRVLLTGLAIPFGLVAVVIGLFYLGPQ